MEKNNIKCLDLLKSVFFTAMTFFNFNLSKVNSLKCVSMNNQECKIRPKIINLNTNEPLFYPYSIKINKWKGSCDTINDPYAKICVPDNIKNTNVKVFNLYQELMKQDIQNGIKHVNVCDKCKCL